jgi:tRNA pseudouridine38-40 synthase
MPRFKLTLEYAGTRYSGWQIQKNARTVQGELDRAIRAVFDRERLRSPRSAPGAHASWRPDSVGPTKFELYGSGRTDAGVHALAQVAHLDIATTLPPHTLLTRINDELPADINLLRLDKASHKFHARHSAVGRGYLYQVARRRTAFAKPYVWWVREPLDVDAMRTAAAACVGLHDFQSFTDDDPEEKSTKVLLERLDLETHDSSSTAGDTAGLLLVRIAGSHFVWKMVRRLVGVLVAVGRGELTQAQVRTFVTQKSGVPATLTAPASGLFLEFVRYEGDPEPAPHQPVISL